MLDPDVESFGPFVKSCFSSSLPQILNLDRDRLLRVKYLPEGRATRYETAVFFTISAKAVRHVNYARNN